jgi:hypothetical protein
MLDGFDTLPTAKKCLKTTEVHQNKQKFQCVFHGWQTDRYKFIGPIKQEYQWKDI